MQREHEGVWGWQSLGHVDWRQEVTGQCRRHLRELLGLGEQTLHAGPMLVLVPGFGPLCAQGYANSSVWGRTGQT